MKNKRKSFEAELKEILQTEKQMDRVGIFNDHTRKLFNARKDLLLREIDRRNGK